MHVESCVCASTFYGFYDISTTSSIGIKYGEAKKSQHCGAMNVLLGL